MRKPNNTRPLVQQEWVPSNAAVMQLQPGSCHRPYAPLPEVLEDAARLVELAQFDHATIGDLFHMVAYPCHLFVGDNVWEEALLVAVSAQAGTWVLVAWRDNWCRLDAVDWAFMHWADDRDKTDAHDDGKLWIDHKPPNLAELAAFIEHCGSF